MQNCRRSVSPQRMTTLIGCAVLPQRLWASTAMTTREHGDRRRPGRTDRRPGQELGPCVVCLTTHGRGRLHGAVVGSVARSLLQRSPATMIALGPMADNPGWSPRPRTWPEPLSVPRIVACVDGSDASEQVLAVAAARGRALGMTLTILTVVEDVPTPVRPQLHRSRYRAGLDADGYIEQLVQHWRGRVPRSTARSYGIRSARQAASGLIWTGDRLVSWR